MNRLQLITTIVPKGKGSLAAASVMESADINGLILQGEGTAGADVWESLGITKEREIFLCFAPESATPAIVDAIHNKLNLHSSGTGVMFASPLSRYLDKDPNRTQEVMNMSASHELILIRTRSGFAREVMETAKKAGAGGGTIIHGRCAGNEVKFFNIELEEEADLLLIAVPANLTKGIIKAVATEHGHENAVSVALPVTNALGI